LPARGTHRVDKAAVGVGALGMVAEGGGFSLFEKFQAGAATWTIVIFLLSLPLMIKFVFGPIVSALYDRDHKVEAAAAAAEEAKREAVAAVAKAQEERELARAEARKMVQEAQTRAERQAQEALDAARAEADRQMDKARADIEAAKRRALLEIRQEVVNLSIASAGKILRHDVDDAAHRQLVDEFLGSMAES
jgi:F-type H+-transporting ATPase subunit b